MIANAGINLRYGLRQLLRRPAFALAAIASLAIGIAANTVLFSVLDTMLFRPLPGLARADELVEIGRSSEGHGFDTLGAPDLADVASSVPALSHVFGSTIAALNVRASGEAQRALGLVVSESYFETLGVTMALGRAFASIDAGKLDGDPSVVISDGAWRRLFAGDAKIIGRTVAINGASFRIIGVAAPGFHGHVAAISPEFYVPLSLDPLINSQGRQLLTGRGSRWLLAAGRLAPGATLATLRAQLDALATRLATSYPETHRNMHLGAAPLSPLPSEAQSIIVVLAGVMFALVGLVLVLACVNVAGMLLARGAARGGELAVRVALGASRGRLVQQLFAEGLVLALAACVAGLALAGWGRGLMNLIPIPAPFPVHIELAFDGKVVAFALGVSVLTSLIFALLPALRDSQRNPRAALVSGGATGTIQRTRVRDGLVVVQIAVSLVLLVAAALFLRSLGRAADVDPGFRAEGVLYADFDLQPAGYEPDRSQAVVDDLLQRVSAMPGVQSAAVTGMLPLSLSRMSFGDARTENQPDRLLGPDVNTISPGYFDTLGMKLRGRDFAAADKRGGDDVAVINEMFASQLFGEADPMGRTFQLGEDGDWRTLRVVGLVGDGKYASLSEERTAFLFLPAAQWDRYSLNLLVRTDLPPAAFETSLRGELARVDPNLPPLSLHRLTDVTQLSVLPQRIAGYVATVLGMIGLLLAGTGLYGVLAFYVAQRKREIGVRLALGATRSSVIRTVLARAARLASGGLLIGSVLALGASQLLSSLLFGIGASDALAFIGAALVLSLVAALATWGPAWHAASVQPSQALRYE